MTVSHRRLGAAGLLLPILALAACTPSGGTGGTKPGAAAAAETAQDTILRGRILVLSHACGDCHGGFDNPAAPGFLDGMRDTLTQQFRIGPFVTRSRNLTPDATTGTGRFSERQLFNALRYGLRPGDTPDTTITSATPGQGNFPATPHYLAPPMPWPSWRHMSDAELWAIAVYIKRGLKPVSHKVQDSDGPPDFWAGAYKQLVGANPPLQFPTVNEKAP
jgi:alcohol dehydrogenase (quinone), cytochrome c subunit